MKTIDCGIISDLLSAYLDGNCSQENRAIIEEHLSSCAHCRDKLAQIKSGRAETRERALEALKEKRLKQRKQMALGLLIFCVLTVALIMGTMLLKIYGGDTAATSELEVVCLRLLDDTTAEIALRSSYPGYEINAIGWEGDALGNLVFSAELVKEKTEGEGEKTIQWIRAVTSNPYGTVYLAGKQSADRLLLWRDGISSDEKKAQLELLSAGNPPDNQQLSGFWIYKETDRAASTFYYFDGKETMFTGSWTEDYQSVYAGTYTLDGNQLTFSCAATLPQNTVPLPPIKSLIVMAKDGTSWADITKQTRTHRRAEKEELTAEMQTMIADAMKELGVDAAW